MHARALRNPLAYAALILPPAAVIDYKLIPLAMAATLAAAAVAAWPWKLRIWPPLAAGLALLLAWSLLSASWSIDPGHSLARFARLALTVAAGVLLCQLAASLASADRRDVARWLAAGVLLASAFVGFRQTWLQLCPAGIVAEFLIAGPVTAYNSVAVLFVLALLATLNKAPVSRLTLAAVVAAVAAIVASGSTASIAALGSALIAYAAVAWLGRKAVQALAVLLPVAFLAFPLSLGTLDLPSHIKAQGWIVGGSIGHRMIIWRYVSEKIRAKPVLGWGLHTGRLLPDRENRADGDPRYADIFAVTWFGRDAKIELMPLHPHNATLHLWLELGAVGAALYAALYALCLLGLLRIPVPRAALAGGAGAITGTFMLGQLSFSVWQSWWLCVQFLVAALYILTARRDGGA
ncbi:MAG: O-antigen ligase family protein, partial [Alphaproteobacteria bacterium]